MSKWENLCPGCFLEKEAHSLCEVCGYDEQAPRSPLVLPHKTLLANQYLIGKVLGKPGGFGITYLGLDVRLKTKVAVKEFLPRDLAGRHPDGYEVIPHSSEEEKYFQYGLARFLQEAQTLAQLDHPNIVRVVTYLEANGTAYLVMNYYEGITLSEFISRSGGKIAEDAMLAIMNPVLDGLKEVHRKGFLHRDIKPQNIYLSNEGKAILLDFGAARSAMREQSRGLSVVLSPGFAPYEQYHRKGEQGAWTDVYGCAATMYYVLTGNLPPEATERQVYQHDQEINEALRNVSPAIRDGIRAGMAVNPKERPQSIESFQFLLEGKTPTFVEQKTIQKLPSTIDQSSVKTYSGEVPKTIAVNPSFDAPSRKQPVKSPHDKTLAKKQQKLLLPIVGVLVGLLAVIAYFFWPQGLPDVLVVSRIGNGHFATIQEAVNAASEGTIIEIESGLYRESLEIAKPLQLIGKVETGEIIIEGTDKQTIASSVGEVALKNLVLKGGEKTETVLLHTAGAINLENITISGGVASGVLLSGNKIKFHFKTMNVNTVSGDGVIISSDAAGIIEDAQVFDNGGWGIQINSESKVQISLTNIYRNGEGGIRIEESSPEITDVAIYENNKPGIYVTKGASPIIKDSKIHNGKQNGLFFNGQSTGTIENVNIFENKFAGIAITEGSNPTLKGLDIQKGEDVGLWIYEGGRGEISNSTIAQNAKHGVMVQGNANPSIKNVKVYENAQNGMYFYGKALGKVEDAEIYGNALAGVAIKEEANPTFLRGIIRDGKETGIYVYDGGLGTFDGCEISHNAFQNVSISTNGNPTITNAIIHSGQSSGVWVEDGGLGVIEFSKIYGNATVGIGVRERGDPKVRDTEIYENGEHGIWINVRGRGTFTKNHVHNNKAYGIYIDPLTATLIDKDNNVVSNQSGQINDLGF